MQPPTEPTLRSHIDTKKKTHDQSLIYTGHDWRQKWRNRVQDDAEKASVDSFAYAHYLSLLRDSTEEATRAIDCWKWATSTSSSNIQRLAYPKTEETSSESVREERPSKRTFETETTTSELCTKFSCSQPNESMCPSHGSRKKRHQPFRKIIFGRSEIHPALSSHKIPRIKTK